MLPDVTLIFGRMNSISSNKLKCERGPKTSQEVNQVPVMLGFEMVRFLIASLYVHLGIEQTNRFLHKNFLPCPVFFIEGNDFFCIYFALFDFI